jgi:transcriptional regulator with PAS, ATPase and Fis domain
MMIGQSPPMQELRARITRLASTQFTVLIEGESGAGKELVAREIHQLGPRRSGPFVPVNCAAIVDSLLEAELFGIEDRTATGVRGRRGKFELADHGTLFLDEVADLSAAAQAKLLRVLQDFSVERVGGNCHHRVDTRVVVATNRSLRSLVEAGQFRADLYYRISGVELVVPPLRERRQDVPLLVEYFAGRNRRIRQLPLEPTALGALVAHDWPGNIRQLARVFERALALSAGPSISLRDLPADVTREYREAGGGDVNADHTLRGCIGRYARLILDQCQGNKRRACEILDITYHTLQTYLEYEQDGEVVHRPTPGAARPHAPAMVTTMGERTG